MEVRTRVFTWSMAEELAVAHMRHLGFADARRTVAGADGGLDVLATGAVAQVKCHAQPVGAPDIQRLRGAAHGISRPVFYSRNGYTAQALDFAERADVALFAFDEHNFVTPANGHAQVLASDHSAGGLRELAALAESTLAMIRQVKATHVAIDEALDAERARAIVLRGRLEAGDHSADVQAELSRIDLEALGRWVTDRYAPYLKTLDDGPAKWSEAMDEAASSGTLPQRDHMEAVARISDDWRSRQTALVHELAALLHVDPGLLLLP